MSASASTPLRLRPEPEELERLVAYIEGFAEQHELSLKDAYALNLAAEELFANTVKHSHPPATFIEFQLERDTTGVAATYTDDGAPFDPTTRAAVDITLTAEQRQIGGLGIHFIVTTMQDFCYERRESCNISRFRRVIAA